MSSLVVRPASQTYSTPVPVPATDSRRGGLLILAAILLVALNLRAAVASVGPLLAEISDGLGMSTAMAGVVTMLPTVSFAAIGAATPRLTARIGPSRLLLTGMALLAVGQILRALTSSVAVFLVTSALALAGVAVGNILLPVLVKRHFPDRIGLVTGAYTMTMILGTSLAAATSVPVAHTAGTWRMGLGLWAVFAVVALAPWLALSLRSRAESTLTERSPVRPWRTRVGWALGLCFGAQAFSGYALMGWLPQLFRDAGYSARAAGLLLGGMMALGIPIALAMPTLIGRRPDQRRLVAVLATCSTIAYAGLAVAPYRGAVVWVVLLALGQGAFPLVLAMIGLRARTPGGTVALSAFAQSTGYLIAALGPLAIGLLYDLTGGWYLPLGLLLAALAGQLWAGLAAARPRILEDGVHPNGLASVIIGRHEPDSPDPQ